MFEHCDVRRAYKARFYWDENFQAGNGKVHRQMHPLRCQTLFLRERGEEWEVRFYQGSKIWLRRCWSRVSLHRKDASAENAQSSS